MGFIAPFIPYIIQGASAVASWYSGKKAQERAAQRSPEEQAALGGLQGAAGSLTGSGVPAVGQATNYWSRLLGGNRALQSQATAGPRAALGDVYSGAERSLERQGVRGGERTTALADLSRQRAGAISGLVTGVQPQAASQLGAIGTSSAQLGSGIYGNLLGQGYQNRLYARGQGQEAGQGYGSLLFDILTGVAKAKGWGQKTSSLLPSYASGLSGAYTPPSYAPPSDGSWEDVGVG